VLLFHQLLDPALTNAVIFRLRMVDDDRSGGLFGTQLHTEFHLIKAQLLNRLLEKYLIRILARIGLIELFQHRLLISAGK
jgi:hypothetical protein